MGAKETYDAWRKISDHAEEAARSAGVSPAKATAVLWAAVGWRTSSRFGPHWRSMASGVPNNIMAMALMYSYGSGKIEDDEWAWAQNASRSLDEYKDWDSDVAFSEQDVVDWFDKVLPQMAELDQSCVELEPPNGGDCDYDW
tara:strand:- start:888 stop:1313 length:426 start_codon:yes stop_codon:yes gene_type:complete